MTMGSSPQVANVRISQFGVMGALVALGAAMLAGRRSFSEEDTDE